MQQKRTLRDCITVDDWENGYENSDPGRCVQRKHTTTLTVRVADAHGGLNFLETLREQRKAPNQSPAPV